MTNGKILLTGENAQDWAYPISTTIQLSRYNENEEADWRILMEHNLNEEDLINRKISAKEIYEELGLLGVAQLSPPEKEILILYGCLKIRDDDWSSLSEVLQEVIKRYDTVDVILNRTKQKVDEKRNRKAW